MQHIRGIQIVCNLKDMLRAISDCPVATSESEPYSAIEHLSEFHKQGIFLSSRKHALHRLMLMGKSQTRASSIQEDFSKYTLILGFLPDLQDLSNQRSNEPQGQWEWWTRFASYSLYASYTLEYTNKLHTSDITLLLNQSNFRAPFAHSRGFLQASHTSGLTRH